MVLVVTHSDSAYSAIQTYSTSGWFNYTNANGTQNSYHVPWQPPQNANPDLKMGTYSHVEHRAGLQLFGGRLGGTIEYYDKRTSDLIYTYEVSTNRYPFRNHAGQCGRYQQ